MKYTDGIKLFNKNAAEWAMCIFFESANDAYGFMRRSTYNYLVTGELDQDDWEMVYRPEGEFLNWVNSDPTDFFRKIYDDCMRKYPDRTPWLEKIRYRGILSKQLDLDPTNCKSEIDVHTYRKSLAMRWFFVLKPYFENYKLAYTEFYPGVIPDMTARFTTSVSLLSARDTELGLNDLGEIARSIKSYKELYGDLFPIEGDRRMR